MPIYAYRCEGCGFQKDALQKMSDAPLVDCPACGAPKLAKQLTAAGFALKGSGWYVTDFRDSGKKPAQADNAAPAADAASGAPSKPDAAASTAASATTSATATTTATASGTTPASSAPPSTASASA